MSLVPELREALVRAAQQEAAGSRPRAAWRRHLGGLGVALAGVVAIAVVAVVIAFGGGPATPTGSPGTPPGLAAGARRAAAALLAQAPRLPGAVEVPSDPSSGPNNLGTLPDQLQADHVVDAHAYYVVRMSPQQIIDAFTQHARALQGASDTSSGMAEAVAGSAAESTGAGPHHGHTVWQSYSFDLPASGRILRLLAVQVTAARGGGTAVRIDAQAGWDSPRPANTRIPAGVRRIDVWLSGPPGHNAPSYRRTVRGADARFVVAWLNALRQAPAGGINGCSPRAGNYAELSIEGADGQLGRATVSLGCGSTAVTVAGQPSVALGWTSSDMANFGAMRRTAHVLKIISGYSYLQVGNQTSGQSSGSASGSGITTPTRSG